MTSSENKGESLGRFSMYLYYTLSTLRLRSYGQWKRDGQPNPFLKTVRARDEIDRRDIAATFSDQFTGRTLSRLYGPLTRRISPKD